jgi:hypothetical protein
MEAWEEKLKQNIRQKAVNTTMGFNVPLEEFEKAAPIGTRKTWQGGREFIKTAEGWKPVPAKDRQLKVPEKPDKGITSRRNDPEKKKEPAVLNSNDFDLKKYVEQIHKIRKEINALEKERLGEHEAYRISESDPRKIAIKDEVIARNENNQVKLAQRLSDLGNGVKLQLEGFSGSDLNGIMDGTYKTSIAELPRKTEKIKRVYDFIKQPSIIGFLGSVAAKYGTTHHVAVDYKNVKTVPGSSIGTFDISLNDKNWRSDNRDSFTVNAIFDGKTVHLLDIQDRLDRVRNDAESYHDKEKIQLFTSLKKFAEEFSSVKPTGANIDTKFAALKERYEKYYNSGDRGQRFSSLYKISDNELNFDVGNIGKKQQVHDTIRDAARMQPPSQIGDYKLVSADKVLAGGKLIDKKKLVADMLDTDNEYSEYEHNISFVYQYKK